MTRKTRVGIIFGGRSSEHEVSVASARSVMQAIDQSRYDIVPIAISPSGQWLPGVSPAELASPLEMTAQTNDNAAMLPVVTGFARFPSIQGEVGSSISDLDIVFPVLHGAQGEDGAIQGMLEMGGLPYVGCGILGSALGLDKDKAKIMFQSVGLPVVPWITIRRYDVEHDLTSVIATIEERFAYPVFVKPTTLGSSVGVNKAHDAEELRHALQVGAQYDRSMLIEPSINCRELECAVLGNDDPQASVVGEVVTGKEFYDYEAKYLGAGSELFIPAQISDERMSEIRQMAVDAFRVLDLAGLARVDFFLDRDSGQVYLNEVNTLPGFTEISMYPKLWAATGITYPELIDRLIQLGIERHEERNRSVKTARTEM